MKVETDLGAIERNLDRIQTSARKPLILMCKADAYGHGAAEVTRHIKAAYYGVATETEGIPIRDLGKQVLVTAPSLSMMPLSASHDMIPLVGSLEIARQAADAGVRRCRIKVNSGMNRLGFTGERECYRAALFLTRAGIAVEGADTHYKEDSDDNIRRQNATFCKALSAIRAGLAAGGYEGGFTTSVTGTGALFAGEFDYLRVGLAAYGYHTGYATAGLPLEPAMKVTSEVIKRKRIRAGESLGYASFGFVASHSMWAYTVLGGYADGVSRSEVGRKVIAAGRRLSVAAVCMDTFEMISDSVDLPVGQRVIILSKGVDAAYVAQRRGTIPYEVLVGYNVPRAERIYAY